MAIGRARSRRAESSSGRCSVSKVSEARVVSNGETETTASGRRHFSAAAMGPGRSARASRSGPPRSWSSSGTRSACAGLFFTLISREINYPYRAFFADELRAGRFSRWCPGLYCGMPLFSESQAGYLHPLKYLALSLASDLAGVQPRHSALGLADGGGDVLLAAAARRTGGGTHRGRDLRRQRLCLGTPDPHQHDQRPGQRAFCDLGAGKLVGKRADGAGLSWVVWPWRARSSRAICKTPC